MGMQVSKQVYKEKIVVREKDLTLTKVPEIAVAMEATEKDSKKIQELKQSQMRPWI